MNAPGFEAASLPVRAVRAGCESSGGAVDLAFELGWDYAHHGVTPPADRLERLERSRGVEQGYRAGKALFGTRTLHADRFVRKWLQLRLGALERGRSFDCQGTTPAYLASIDVACCPIVRESLTHQCQLPSDWSIDRVDNRADYVAGNLAVISVRANRAKHDYGFRDALSFTRQCESLGSLDGLDASQWARLAVLASFVEPLEPDEAAGLPMLVLPPPGLVLANPVQALQAAFSRALLQRDYVHLIARLRAAVPGKALRKDFDAFEKTWRARVVGLARNSTRNSLPWLVEDAWQCRLLARRWRRFARGLAASELLQVLAAAGDPARSPALNAPSASCGARRAPAAAHPA